ncbi:hypothetical protein D3C84_992560 [compost metagenome]
MFNGRIYESQTTGGTSTKTIPAFTGTPGETVGDLNVDKWQPTKTYAWGDLVKPPTSNGYYYKCSMAGTSGSNEPKWSTATPFSDGTTQWSVQKMISWKEIGVKAVFKPYGLIQT